MSFSSEQKELIIEKPHKSRCCRRSLLQGALFAKASVDGGVICLSLQKREYCDFLAKLIHEFYGRSAVLKRSNDGGRRYLLSFESDSALKYIAEIQNGAELFSQKCEICLSAFLKGVFLASARASNPSSAYSIHFSIFERSDRFRDFLVELGILAHIFDADGEKTVYIKESASIESFFGYAGMNKAMFSLIDARLEGEIRKNVARVSNCETNNIKKAVDAAGKQYDIICALDEANLLSSLPDDLESTARLRLAHKEMSLSQLAAIATPPISKPGLSHRLKKIMQIGERLLDRSEK